MNYCNNLKIYNKIYTTLDTLLKGDIPPNINVEEYPYQYRDLVKKINQFIQTIYEIDSFIDPLSKGILTLTPPKSSNLMASPFKELHSQLSTIVWQTQQVALGDYSQRIYFMGDFSKAFNQMVESLDKNRKEQRISIQYRKLLEQSYENIFFINKNGDIFDTNKCSEKSYGYSHDEFLKKSFYSLFFQDESDSKLISHSLENIEETIFECKGLRKDGTFFPCEINIKSHEMDGHEYFIVIVRNFTEQKKNEEKLRFLETHDVLTKLPNRYLLEKALEKKGCYSAILFIDVDHLKLLNDTFGHSIGDIILTEMSEIIQNNLRSEDFFARIGGDEFAILLSKVNLEEAKIIAEKLRKFIENNKFYPYSNDSPVMFSISIGIAPIKSNMKKEEILTYADFLLYQAKLKGRNTIVTHKEGNLLQNKFISVNQTLELIHDGLENNNFQLYFQPIVNIFSGKTIHYEGLIRLLNDGNIIYPNDFLPVAKFFGIMNLIDRKVVILALESLYKYSNIKLFINISASSIGNDEFLNFIIEKIEETKIDPSRLGFEITETETLKDMSSGQVWIEKLKELGCPFALDDFGTGFSSFSYLQSLPVDFLKIDGSFVRDIITNKKHQVLVKTMNEVAILLGKESIVEFVENEEIYLKLKELNIKNVQGYYFGRPEQIPKY